MEQYHNLLTDILDNGENRQDRTNTGTISVFGRQLRFDLNDGFPAVTTKKLAFKAVVSELLWFLEGSNDERRLAEILHGSRDKSYSTIWTGNAEADYWKNKSRYEGDLGRIYGVQWRSWRGPFYADKIDQVNDLIESIKKDPYSRRHIINAWNVAEIEQMALPPCHVMSQFYVSNNKKLSCHMYQRSADVYLGIPFNIASYALLTHMIAQVCDLSVGELIISIGDAHLYVNHLTQVKEQLSRDSFDLPSLWLNQDIKDINSFTMNDIKLLNYKSHGKLPATMAV